MQLGSDLNMLQSLYVQAILALTFEGNIDAGVVLEFASYGSFPRAYLLAH